MKSVRNAVFVVFAIAVLCGVAQVVIPTRQAGRETTPASATTDRTPRPSRPRSTMRSVEPRVATAPLRQRPSPPESPAPSVSESRAELVQPDVQAHGNKQEAAQAGATTQKSAQTKQGTPPAPEVLQDPVARVALGYVGADPDAEAYWYGAINDPSLSAHERQDLIEDLNEDGLSDPQNPSLEDLPLILSRIELIESVVWDAMDEVNADAFQEAHKDLVNLAIQAMGNG
jgi:hypothetical protein